MDVPIPAGCLALCRRLASCGYPAHLVGGCVRDLCRGVFPHDYDLTTSATPDEMKRAFSGYRVIETSARTGEGVDAISRSTRWRTPPTRG